MESTYRFVGAVTRPKRTLGKVLILLVLGGLSLVAPQQVSAIRSAYGTQVILTSGSSWTVPADWNNENNAIEVIGAGGGGGGAKTNGGGEGGGGGGAGGAYAIVTNQTLSGTVGYSIGVAGSAGAQGSGGGTGGNTWFCSSTSNCATIGGTSVIVGGTGGTGGGSGSGTPGGSAGTTQAGSVGTVNLGGAGAAGGNGVGSGAGGGGGGGGGAGGGTAVGTAGTAGSNGSGETTGGAGGSGGQGDPAAGGAGGSGGSGGTPDGDTVGGTGTAGTEWTTAGSGGGGGGGGGSGKEKAASAGGPGGSYGAGGGGGGGGGQSSNGAAGAAGKPGVIVITYTPAGSVRWDGGGSGDNWNTCQNWEADACPGTGDLAVFGTMSNNDADINVDINIGGIYLAPSYTGTVTQQSGNSITVGSGGLYITSGSFVGGDSFIDVNGTFGLNSSFVMTTGTMTVSATFTFESGAVFTKGGALRFDGDLNFADYTSPQQDLGAVEIDPTTTLTTDMTATSLKILTGDTLVTDGYEITLSGTMDINGTLDAGSGTDGNSLIKVGGIWDMTGGMFTATDSTVMFTGTTAGLTITSDSKAFNNIIINGTFGLVGYWKLDETAENSNTACNSEATFDDACDASGHGHHGEWISTPVPSTNKPPLKYNNPGSLDLVSGSGEYINITDSDQFDLDASGKYTWSVWINSDSLTASSGWPAVWSQTVSGTNSFYFYAHTIASGYAGPGGSITAGISVWWVNGAGENPGLITEAENVLTTGEWYHVAVTYDGSLSQANRFKIYVNGQNETGSSVSNGTLTSISPTDIRIGSDAPFAGEHFDGKIDEVRFYNRLLTASEIQALADGSMPGTGLGTYTLQDNLDVNGTLSLNDGSLDTGSNRQINVARGWMNHGGIFAANSGSVVFDGTAADALILSGAQTFYSVDQTGSGTWTLQDDLPVSGVYDISAGVLSYSTDPNIEPVHINGDTALTGGTFSGQAARFRHDGDVSVSSGIYTAPTDVTEIDGSFEHTGGTFTNSASTVMFTGTTAESIDTTGGATFSTMIINDGLIGHWNLDESSGLTAFDRSGYGRNGSLSGDINRLTGLPAVNFANNRAMEFVDGVGDYVAVGVSGQEYATYPFSVSFWVRTTVSGVFKSLIKRVLPAAKGSTAYDQGINILISSSDSLGIRVDDVIVANNTLYPAGPDINDGEWHHCVVSVSSTGQINTYVDGNNTGTKTISALAFDSGDGSFGFPTGGSSSLGTTDSTDADMDDVRYYNRVLSSVEVSRLANGNQPGTGLGTYTLQTDLDVDGTLRLNAGTLDAGGNNQINIGGDWENFGGVFLEQTGTVTFDGADQKIPASETFYHFAKEDTTDNGVDEALTFGQQSTTTVQGVLTLNGLDDSDRVNLLSSASGTRFNLSVTGTPVVAYLDVRDSEALGTDIVAANGVDNGNTDAGEGSPQWKFSVIADVSGTANGNEGATVKIAVAGVEQAQTGSISTGTWTISSVVMSSGDPVIVWIDGVGDANEATAVTVYDGAGNVAGVKLDTNVLTLGSDDNAVSLSLAQLALYDYDDNEDIMFTATSGTLAVEASGNTYADETLLVNGGTLSLSVDQEITSHNLTLTGTASLDFAGTGTITLDGNWSSSDGIFVEGNSTVIMTATGTLDATGDSFYNLTIGHTGSPVVVNLASDITVTRKLTIIDANDTITDGGGGSYDVTLTGNGTPLVNNGATVTCRRFVYTNGSNGPIFAAGGAYDVADRLWFTGGNAGLGTTYRLNGDLTVSGTLQISAGFGLVYLDTDSTANYSVTSTGLYVTVSNFLIGRLIGNGSMIDINGNVRLNNAVTDNSLTANTATISVEGGWYAVANEFVAGTSSVIFDRTSGTAVISTAANPFYNMTIDDGGGSATIEIQDSLDVNGTFMLTSGTLDLQTNNVGMNTAGNFILTAGASFLKSLSGTLTFDGDLTYADNTSPQQDIGRLVIGQSPDTTTLTTDMTATSLKIMATDALITDGYNVYLTGTMDINGTLDAASGSGGNSMIRVGGIWDMTGGIFTATDSTVIFTGTATDLTITSDSKAFNNLIVNGTFGLVGYWKLDEVDDNDTVIDYSGFENNGTASNFGAGGGPIANVAQYIQFNDPRSLEFDGADDAVMIPANATLGGQRPLTFAAWIYPQTLGEGNNGRIMGKYNGTTQFRPGFRVNDNNSLLFRFDGSTALQRTTFINTITLNRWQHVAATWDGGTGSSGIHIYVNGVEAAYTSASNGVALNDGSALDFYIGNTDTLDRTFDGYMDDVRVYNRVLSSTEIQALANGDMPGTGLGTYTLQDNLDVNGTLTLNDGTLDTGANRQINVARSWLNHGGGFTANSGLVTFDGTIGGNIILSGSSPFSTVTIVGNFGEWSLQDDMTLTNQLVISLGDLTYSTDSNIEPITINGPTTINGPFGAFAGTTTSFRHNGDLIINDGTYTAPTDVLKIDGSFDHSGGTFTNSGSTVMFTGTTTETINTSGGGIFNDVIINDGLVAYWKMEETASPSVDYSGHGNTGTWQGTPAASTDLPSVNFKDDRSLAFDANADYVNVPASASLDSIYETDRITVAVWTKNDAAPVQYDGIVGNPSDDNWNNGWGLYYNAAGVIRFYASQWNVNEATSAITAQQWNHVVGMYDGTNVRIFVNGVEGTADPYSGQITDSLYPVTIGKLEGSGPYNIVGKVDEVRIYNRALSVAEIQALANGDMPASALGTYTLQTALDIAGTLRLNAGTVDVSAGDNYQINVGGNWENFGGVFDEQLGTVVFDGADQEIPASETFYIINKTLSAGPARTLTVGQQSTLTVGGTLTLSGFNASNRLNVHSSTTGTRFTVDVTGGEQTVSAVNVRDSQASSNNIVTSQSVDSGNTDRPEAEPHWIFGPLRGAVIIVD